MEKGIKFNSVWKKTKPFPQQKVEKLIAARQRLYRAGFIYGQQGIGHGNISMGTRVGFLITGSGTGILPRLSGQHFSLVEKVDIRKNRVHCSGPVQASSEAMTHFAIYQSDPRARCVIHIHSPTMWKQWYGALPTTTKKAKYGTVELAKSVLRLLSKKGVRQTRAFVLGGHRPGLFIYGTSIVQAEKTLKALQRPL